MIELLVVIAIIAILAAILFPVFARARENARRSSCSSNMKQIALGVIQYTQDYDETFPRFQLTNSIDGSFAQIQPYLKSTQILRCPSDSTVAASSDPNNNGYTSYAYNLTLGLASYDSTVSSLSLAALTQPTLTVLHDDTYGRANGGRSNAQDTGCPTSDACAAGVVGYTIVIPASQTPAQRHLEGLNYSFTDGHVKWYKSATATTMANVYNLCTKGSAGGTLPPGYGCDATSTVYSGQNPTYNPTP